MVIVKLSGGTGNQFFQYAIGRCIAYKLNTELKLNLSRLKVLDGSKPDSFHSYYRLGAFNIQENFATPEEVKYVSDNGIIPPPLPDLKDCKQDILIQGNWMHNEIYYADIIDIIRKEFTFKNPLSPSAEAWKQKILSAECSVSMHFRHGDYIYDPSIKNKQEHYWSAILPLDYYYTCLYILKQKYKKITVFVFSDNINWCKENLHLDVPTEFVSVSGGDKKDDEELYLMSLCNHNIMARSTFSYFAASMNSNPDKKIFNSFPSDAKGVQQYHYLLKTNKIILPDSQAYINVPFDLYNQPEITVRPIFSLLLVINDDIATLVESLSSFLDQDYKYFELIIVDNVSTDGSGKVCREVLKNFDKVTLIKLHEKVQNGAAWNIALKSAQGYYVMFLKGNDFLLSNALTSLYLVNERRIADIVNSTAYLKEDTNGDIDIAGRKFSKNEMSVFQNLNDVFREKLDKSTLLKILSSDETFFPLATRIFGRKFLEGNKILFNEKIGDDAENLFVIDALFQTEEIIFTSQPTYIAPNN